MGQIVSDNTLLDFLVSDVESASSWSPWKNLLRVPSMFCLFVVMLEYQPPLVAKHTPSMVRPSKTQTLQEE